MAQSRSIDELVGEQTARVYVLSEMGFDTDYFNPAAYNNLLRMIGQDDDVTGIIVDGAITRLDRPEFLNDYLTYWNSDEAECRAETEAIPNREQYRVMMNKQMRILRHRLTQLRERAPDAQVVLSVDSDDTQFSISAIVNEILIRKGMELGETADRLKEERKSTIGRRRDAMATLDGLYGGSKRVRQRRARLKSQIEGYDSDILRLEDSIESTLQERALFREKKVRPAHQYFTNLFMQETYQIYAEMCRELGVTFVAKPSVLTFGDLVVDYAHSRHDTWGVLKTRDKRFQVGMHGKMADILAQDVVPDVILESGHSGIGWKQLQKAYDENAETNFEGQGDYDPTTADGHLTLVLALPFEDQARVRKFMVGNKPARMSGGKPMGTRKHACVDRYKNDGVSGVTIITRDSNGIVGTEWMQYGNFLPGVSRRKPSRYGIIAMSSDEHIASPEENIMARDGWSELVTRIMSEPVMFRGRPAIGMGYVNAGDVGEANSRKWQHRYQHKKSPAQTLEENIELLARINQGDPADVNVALMRLMQQSLGGSVESMSDVLERVADYLGGFVHAGLQHSELKHACTFVTGNHTDDVMRDLGLRETDFLVQRLKATGVPIYQVGVNEGKQEDARIFFGGYSNARVIHLEDYGISTTGKALFGPLSMVVQHDPKGSGSKGIVGMGKNANADLAIAGHTHETYVRLYRTADNEFGVAYRVATLQGVSPTEKFYASSHTRTQAAHLVVMPKAGDFSEKSIPSTYLSGVGREVLVGRIEDRLKDNG